jgi:prophage regulatory protein
MPASTLLTWTVYTAFNLPIIGFVVAVPFARRLDEALAEKTPAGEATGITSYARVTAALGAVILTAFFWALKRRVGLGKSMIYRLIQEGKFPAPYKLSPFASRWSDCEIVAWIDDVKDGFEGKKRKV